MAKRKSTRAPQPDATARLSVRSQYDAAGGGRRMRGWMPPTSGPNRATAGLQRIRDRAQDAVRNDWSGASGATRWATTLVGIGIVPRFKGERRAAIAQLFADWSRHSDADCVLGYYGQQTLAVRSWFTAGEVFARLRWRRLDAPLAVPLQVQLIESEFVPLLDADSWPGMPSGNRIRSGIELNRWGCRVAYWMHREHPADGAAVDRGLLVRVPVDEVLHIFEPKRPGQLRGVSELAAVLARIRSTGDFDDAVLERQKLANLYVTFIKRAMPPDWSELETDPDTGLPVFYDQDGDTPMAPLMPGTSQELLPGEEVQFAAPPAAGTDYSAYMRTQNTAIAAGAQLPYELLSGDIRDVSDRTLRVVINEFRRHAEQRQYQILIPQLCEPILAAWGRAAALAGHITPSEAREVEHAEHATHGWAYLHPVQDAQGRILEVKAGLRARSEVVSERGYDAEAVDLERAADAAREKALGLTQVAGE